MNRLVPRLVGVLFQHRNRQGQVEGADATWQMLQAVNRINLAHWQATQAMRTEAARQQGDQDQGSW